MKKNTLLLVLWMLVSMTGMAQNVIATPHSQGKNVEQQLKENPLRAYGNDCPYLFEDSPMTAAPEGYEPFYISHYARHGSRYYWTDKLYKELDTLLTVATERQLLTAEGETFCRKFMAVKDELMTGVSELTQLGWEQHQQIARRMYNTFPEVFSKGGNVLAISSLSGRCVLSMSAFCQELVQCNPQIEVREQSSRFTLDAVVPTDKQNPVKHHYQRVMPRYFKQRNLFHSGTDTRAAIALRVLTSTEGLPYSAEAIGEKLINLYTTLPSIGYMGMMGTIVTDQEMVDRWESSNLWSYGWVFGPQYQMIPILQDIIGKAEAVISGSSDHVADLRFGHDTCIGPLTVLMGINGADHDPEDPNEVKYYYQNWETCKACNIQLVFYRIATPNSQGEIATPHSQGENVLVKCLLNGVEATLPVPTTMAPYYKWSDFCQFYRNRIAAAPDGVKNVE